ncbi:Rs1 [Symbiodinium natans]|uniref:Rs1 protein n=1 Tax=Symbiodinium natans TaxID=878477 RepID=A0A812LUV9_9DINO|nr:Rs1 [Symbiodinium natans]
MLGKSSTEAWSISFACKVFGDFADPGIPTISADLAITIRDTTCWAEDTVMGLAETLQPLSGVAPADEGSCRKLCRVRSSCAYYKWDQGNCSQVVKRADGGWLQAIAKIWNCSNTDTCREVRTATWYYNGIYCPVGADTLRNSVIYFKEGTTPQEELVLYQHREAVDGAIPGCLDGSWVIKLSSRADYKKPQMGYFEMHGEARHCASPGEVLFATLPCGPPENVTEEEVKVQKIILDDPATPAGADFWLHPCECASAAWGADMPVDPVTYEMTGDAETATYIPPPLMLVNGEFVCPNRNLLPNPGVYFETEAESMEYEVCEAKCKNHDDCNFFWHGTQSSATSCRLYSSCDSLVREIGLEGELTAMPRAPGCVVANPQECFTVSMRRQYLTSVAPATFFFWDLHAQCDMMLLLGGAGISACGRPTYRPPDYGDWRHKKKLPASFEHGNTLKVSCWNERYSAVRGSQGTSEEVLTCVNGNWFSSADEPGLGSFNCFECVQVASNGFNKIEERREQELYFFNRMELSVHSEVNQLDSGKVHCMEMKEPISEGVPAGPPSGKSWLAEAKPLYERKPTDVWKMEFLIYSANDKRTFDEEKKWAEDQGGHLVTFAEAWNWIIENPFFFADRGIDMWMPTLEPDGTRDYIQIGRPAWAVSGQSHNSVWGWPGWADDKTLQGWGSGERALLYWKKITIIGSTRELEKNKYQVFRSNAPQPYGGDPRRTWNESKAWVEKQGGRLMTRAEATIFFFNYRYYIDQGLDMWVPVEEADGTRDWIQGGNVHWAAPGTSHTAVFGRAAWEDDISLQGWTPNERILAWKQKEMVTASVWPGDVISLRNAHWGSFARAHSPIMDASGESEIPMPKEWTWERFTVVDAGSNGDVALHNFYHNGFARIRGSDNLADLLLFNFDAFDESWMAWERFQIIELGDGAIALYVPFLRRFLRMPGAGRQMDGSPQVGPLVAQNWVLEKFQVEHLDYAQSPGLVAWYKSEDAAPNWRSAVGDYAAHATHGEAKVYEAQGSGAAAPVRYVYGVAGDSRTPRVAYDFGHIVKPAYTVCSVTRVPALKNRFGACEFKPLSPLSPQL